MIAVNGTNIVSKRLRALKAGDMSYGEIALRYGVSAGTIWRIVNNDHEPTDPDIRRKLGYPIVCPSCGHEFEEGE